MQLVEEAKLRVGEWVTDAMRVHCAQVLIYMRWVRWLLGHITRLHDVILVNMDETRLDNQTQWHHGYHVKRKCQLGVGPQYVPLPLGKGDALS